MFPLFPIVEKNDFENIGLIINHYIIKSFILSITVINGRQIHMKLD